MKKLSALFLTVLVTANLFAQVTVKKDENGWRMFDGTKEVEVKGITWSNNPIGSNYTYSLWNYDDVFIRNMIDYDMPLLKEMGVNAIRCFNDVPPEWVTYIYEKYGIYTIINNLLGRYGVTVDGKWIAKTDYSDPRTRETLFASARETVEKYKDTHGVLMYMWGNESNYGLEWSGSDIENLPVGERHAAKAVYLYSMFNEAIRQCKEIDPNHPHGIVNGDVQYIDIIAKECPELDVFGSNVYRGWKFYDSFYGDVQEKLDKPIIVTECGADAFNARTGKEDQYGQLQYYKSIWKEVYEYSYGKGKAGNILGCVVFEWCDEWWKYLQYTNTTIHDTTASWANGGYSLDFVEGANNMNEEWFGICAQSKEMTPKGISKRIPRATYYFLKDLWAKSMYNTTQKEIDDFFERIPEALYLARGNEESVKGSINELKMLSIESLDTTISSTTPVHINSVVDAYKNHKSFRDAIEYKNDSKATNPEATTNKTTLAAETAITFAFNPFENLSGTTTLKAWTGEQVSHLRDPYASYYEKYVYGSVEEANKGSSFDHKKYVDLYAANVNFNSKIFDLSGFYHTGHGSYAGSGDIFNLSREGYDIVGYDTYGSKAPIGVELSLHKALEGLKVMAGPELWGGASPMVIVNWSKWIPEKGLNKPGFVISATASDGFGERQVTTLAPYNAYGDGVKASVMGEMYIGQFVNIKLAGLFAGNEKLGANYESANGSTKTIGYQDTLGAFAQVGTHAVPYTFIYANAYYRGLAAETNAETLYGAKYIGDSGSSNRIEFKAGAEGGFGPFGINAAFRYRTPIEKATETGRDLIAGSPFAVGLGNREIVDAEAILSYDPEGATWFYDWDSEERENAKVAFSLGGHVVFSAGETDLLIYKDNENVAATTDNGVTKVAQVWRAWPGSQLGKQSGMWEANGRIITNPIPNLKIIGTLGARRTNALTGLTSAELEYLTWYNAGVSVRYKKLIAKTNFIINGPGPESWWQNFNMSFPLQYEIDVAYGLGKAAPSFLDGKNRIGVKVIGRTFGENSSDAYHALPKSVIDDNTVGGVTDLSGQKYLELTFYLSMGL